MLAIVLAFAHKHAPYETNTGAGRLGCRRPRGRLCPHTTGGEGSAGSDRAAKAATSHRTAKAATSHRTATSRVGRSHAQRMRQAPGPSVLLQKLAGILRLRTWRRMVSESRIITRTACSFWR